MEGVNSMMDQAFDLSSIFPNLSEGYFAIAVTLLDVVILLLFSLHFIFSSIMLKQVNILDKTLTTRANGYIKVFSWLHFLASFCLLVFSAAKFF
jgi:hypothetical protein